VVKDIPCDNELTFNTLTVLNVYTSFQRSWHNVMSIKSVAAEKRNIK